MNGTPLDIALGYIARGWSPIPVRYRSKALDGVADAEIDKWHIDAQTAPQYFNGKSQNVGMVLGAVSGGLVDVDLDDPLALQLRRHTAPVNTVRVRSQKQSRYHRLYTTNGDPGPVKPLHDGEGMLVEYRANGGMRCSPAACTRKPVSRLSGIRR